jgi:hypothetical protein
LFEKKCGVVRASEEVLHKLQFFVELLQVEFMEQSLWSSANTPSGSGVRRQPWLWQLTNLFPATI